MHGTNICLIQLKIRWCKCVPGKWHISPAGVEANIAGGVQSLANKLNCSNLT